MKIGIQTDLLDTNGYGRWKDKTYMKLREHGYNCSDFSMANTNTPIYTLPVDDAVKLLLAEKNLADKAGIEIVQTHGPWRWPAKDNTPEDRAERMDKMKRSLLFSSILGSKITVLHPLMPYGICDKKEGNSQKTADINIEFFTDLLKTAKKYDVTICLENMPLEDFSLAKPSDILALVNTIDDEHLRVCLDTGHAFALNTLNPADEVRRLASYLKALHIHDNMGNDDLHQMPCFGRIDWDDFASALKETNYRGNFTLETMPPRKLGNPIFENLCVNLYKIAKEIADKI